MSDQTSVASGGLKLPVAIKGPQDFVDGIVLMVIAIFALWASSDLQGMYGNSFGAGTVPRMFSVLLLALGAAVMVLGFVTKGPALARSQWRGPDNKRGTAPGNRHRPSVRTDGQMQGGYDH